MPHSLKSKRGTIVENITVTAYANEGKSIARINNKVVFIDGAVPGDVVNIRLGKVKKDWMEARIEKLLEPSPERIDSFCKHFGTCGGCKWQFLDYSSQLKYKQQSVLDSLQRIGKVESKEIFPIIGSANQKYYRNKLDYSAGDRAWVPKEELDTPDHEYKPALGFHVAGNFTTVLDLDECFLQPEPSNKIRLIVKQFAVKNKMTFYDNWNKHGFLRTMIVRNNLKGEYMVIVVVGEYNEEWLFPLLDEIISNFKEVVSLHYIVNTKVNDTIYDLDVITYFGDTYITETMEDLKFQISPKSFFQTNPTQAYELYKVTRSFAGLTGTELVYDLYTGTGSIALFIAAQAKMVVGIEQVEDAIRDARLNAQLNNISNVKFFTADMRDALTPKFVSEHGKPDVIITDPPRVGMHPDVVRELLNTECNRIVYVSCNPASQARDLQMLSSKYDLLKIQPVDMFPHTHHIENVALLELK